MDKNDKVTPDKFALYDILAASIIIQMFSYVRLKRNCIAIARKSYCNHTGTTR